MKVALGDHVTNYSDAGKGPSIVFVHGLGLDLSLWDEYALTLSDRYRVIRYDIFGHGQSDAPLEPWSFVLFADQLAHLLDHLKVEKAMVVGFSLGGLIAQNFALHHPKRIAGLMIVASVCCRLPEEQQRVDDRFASVQNGGPAAVADDTIRRWFTKDYQRRNPDVVRKWKSKILSNDPDHYRRAYQLFCKADLEFRDSLCRISAPTLIVTGDNDVGQTPRMVREMAKRIPNSRTEITGGVAHMYPIEAADTLTKLISQFTRQCIA